MRNPRWRRTPVKCWLSCEEIRARLELGPGTPSLKHLAKTIAPGLRHKSLGITRGYAGGSRRNGAPPNLKRVRRGVTVVGDLVEQEAERILTGIRVWESMAGRNSPCQTGDGENLASTVDGIQKSVATRFAAFGSGESAYF